MKKCAFIISVFAALLFFNACKKQSENYNTPPLSDYFPLQTGKYVIYDLDSTTYPNFGTKTITHYQVEYYTDSILTDSLGRTEYRVIRYIRNDSTDSWVPDNTFMAVNTGNTIEWVENNLRFIKLAEPITEGFSWNGNSYIYTDIDSVKFQEPYSYLDNWNYSYDSINAPLTLNNVTVDSTIKVNEANYVLNDPNDLSNFSEIIYSSENYAKGIGLVYRNFLYQEYQAYPSTPTGYSGYGVTLTMIDHN